MNDTLSTVGRPGRPPKKISDMDTGLKKGRSSWKPASLNEFMNKEEGYRYRMVRKDAENLAKKKAEGWETVSGLDSSNTAQIDPGRIEHGKSLTSTQEGKDWILQRIPEEMALERDEYFNKENQRRVGGLTAHVKKEINKEGAAAHGEITISSRRGTQVIE